MKVEKSEDKESSHKRKHKHEHKKKKKRRKEENHSDKETEDKSGEAAQTSVSDKASDIWSKPVSLAEVERPKEEEFDEYFKDMFL